MTKPGPSVSILAQLSGAKPFMFERMNALLDKEGLERFRAAVAYARWDGIGLIAPHIETFLKRGGEFQTIYGVANGVTTPDSLLYNLYLQEIFTSHTYAGAIEDQYVNATFHTKFFEFKFADKIIFIVGSANLTGAGMSRNTEMGAEVKIRVGSPLSKQTDDVWKSLRAASQKVTLALIRSSKDDGELGSEHQKNETRSNKGDKPRLRTGVKASPKPLFSKVLDLRQPTKKSKILAKLDTLTVQPQILHLQILTYETGAQSPGGIGYQIQLPVATLGTFFGVGAQQQRQVTFRFPKEVIEVRLTHFENNTHRVRLRPLRDVARPAIVKFRRIEEDEYRCTIVPKNRYFKTLAEKCKEQTRKGARRWGLE